MSVIYEKHYPHPTFEEEMKELEEYEKEMESSPDYKPKPELTFQEFYKNVMKDHTDNRKALWGMLTFLSD